MSVLHLSQWTFPFHSERRRILFRGRQRGAQEAMASTRFASDLVNGSADPHLICSTVTRVSSLHRRHYALLPLPIADALCDARSRRSPERTSHSPGFRWHVGLPARQRPQSGPEPMLRTGRRAFSPSCRSLLAVAQAPSLGEPPSLRQRSIQSNS